MKTRELWVLKPCSWEIRCIVVLKEPRHLDREP